MEEAKKLTTSKSKDLSKSEVDLPFKLEIDVELKAKLKDVPEILEYIHKLEKLIKRHLKKINKLRNKLKIKNSNDAATQTDFIQAPNKNEGSTLDSDIPKSIVDDIKEAAEMAMQKTGFVYEETSGLYYDYNTGYYYNDEYGLYYDGATGSYLQYNADTQSYEFHSQVSAPTMSERGSRNKRKKNQKHKMKDSKRTRIKKDKGNKARDVEDGECSSSEKSTAEEDGDNSDTGGISKSWPPCMRIIVESSDIPTLKEGSLHIITCSGGSIGREGSHSILLRDPSASKHHLKIQFDEKKSQYEVVDLGSRNGTLLNGKRMSPSKQESEAVPIAHGSKIQIGQTVFLCHIHDGNQTCGHCEPGLIQVPKEPEKERIEKNSRVDRHKKELNNLKMLYGVSGHRDEDVGLASGYTDRAQKRRETVGSQNPHEKTQVASVDESINKENKGFKLLSKMGWKEGQSLGRSGEGLLEPIKPTANEGSAGIGSKNVIQVAVPSEKHLIWTKTKERFRKLPENNNNEFNIDSDD